MGKSKKVSDDKEPPASKKQRTQKGVPAEETQTEAVPAAQPQTQAVPAAAAETQTKAVPAAEPRPSRSRSRSRNRQALSDAIAAIPERDVERLVQETGSHSAKEALDKLKNIMDPKFTGETITLVPAELLPDSPSTESDMAGSSRLAPGAAAAHTAASGAGEGQGGELGATKTTTNAAASGAECESPEVMGEGSDQMSQSAASGAVENQQHISTDKVIGFYSHKPGRKFREFSNFWVGETFDFTLPSFAHSEGFPMTIPCEFSEKAIMLVKAAMNKDQTRFQLIRAAADPASTKVRDL